MPPKRKAATDAAQSISKIAASSSAAGKPVKPVKKAAPKKAKAAAAVPASSSASSASSSKLHAGRVFAITGTLSRVRKDVVKLIEAAGGHVRGSVTSDVTHLIAANPYLMTAKMTAAHAKGIVIVDESFIQSGTLAKVYDASTPVAALTPGVHWQFLNDAGAWEDYEKAGAALVEAAYQDWLGNKFVDVRSVKSGQWIYQVDFATFKQTNAQHPSHTVRSIQRVVKK
jgi:ABC-type sugar transport system ATPase subunit